MIARILAISLALILHAGFVLFGGLLLPHKEDKGTLQVVDLLSDEEIKEEKPKEEPPPPPEEQLETEPDQLPTAQSPSPNLEPKLEDASLAAIEAALNGKVGGGDFGEALTFQSGGRIGGLGKAGVSDDAMDRAFSLAEIDQKPQVVFQTTPNYPASLRGRKLEGQVSVIFVVDATGKVINPRVETTTHDAFSAPALEAVRHWRFEPAVKGGQRVACRMRAPIRFKPN